MDWGARRGGDKALTQIVINRNGFAAPGHGFGIILREDRILRRAPSDPLASHSAEPASAARTALATTWASSSSFGMIETRLPHLPFS